MALNPLTQAQQILKAESEILLKKKLTNEEFLKLINNTERYLDRLQDIEEELEGIDRFYNSIQNTTDVEVENTNNIVKNLGKWNEKLKTNVGIYNTTSKNSLELERLYLKRSLRVINSFTPTSI
jgi:predicted O-linked N-acetylglucosamine transferase (SPINDLY family)